MALRIKIKEKKILVLVVLGVVVGGAEVVNLPFAVDGNRRSDGVSSVSPLSSTSPSFPTYVGDTTQSINLRSILGDAKVASELEQGIAGTRDGEFVSEQREARNGPAPSKTFNVSASIRFNPSSFAIQRGEEYSLSASGVWFDGFVKTDANGYEARYDALSRCWVANGRCRPYVNRMRKRLDQARWFELVCTVGDYVWKLRDVAGEEKERYLPIREEEHTVSFGAGRYLKFNATRTGELVCFANDADVLYWNNRGHVEVLVERTSWPPTTRTNYYATVFS